MWRVLEHREVQRSIEKNAIPRNILKKYEVWKDHVISSGPGVLRELRGLRDHALHGEWEGFRSSYLSDKWRVVYRVDGVNVKVFVERVSAHDYRR